VGDQIVERLHAPTARRFGRCLVNPGLVVEQFQRLPDVVNRTIEPRTRPYVQELKPNDQKNATDPKMHPIAKVPNIAPVTRALRVPLAWGGAIRPRRWIGAPGIPVSMLRGWASPASGRPWSCAKTRCRTRRRSIRPPQHGATASGARVPKRERRRRSGRNVTPLRSMQIIPLQFGSSGI